MGGDPGGLRVPSTLAREGSPEMLADGFSAGSAAACRRLPSGLGIGGVIAVAAVVPDPARSRCPGRLYGVDVPAMSLELHEWDIHIVCFGTDGAASAQRAGRRSSAIAGWWPGGYDMSRACKYV